MNKTHKFFNAMLSLDLEGVTLGLLIMRSGLTQEEVLELISRYSSLFYIDKVGEEELLSFRRPRALKTTYFLLKHSTLTSFALPYSPIENRFLELLANPLVKVKTTKGLQLQLGVSKERMGEIFTKFEKKGIVFKRGKRVDFTMLGFPIWSTLVILQIFTDQKPL
jgi:hypothetical protein